MAKLRGQLVLLSLRYTHEISIRNFFYPFTNLKQEKRPCLGENRPKFAAKRKKLKGGDLRNSGVQLRLVESKGRVFGLGHYGHYRATATVKSAYNQNTESHILLDLTAVFWTE